MYKMLKRFDTAEGPAQSAPAPNERVHLLYFDGVSRGNPGPGGAGSVLVVIDDSTDAPRIQWSAGMAYGDPRTTNNVAEYWGLIHELQYAHNKRLKAVHVVGDSALILAQAAQEAESASSTASLHAR